MVRRIRWAIAAPFLIVACVATVIAFMLTAGGWDDTLDKWGRREGLW